jgi:hypothetical protein
MKPSSDIDTLKNTFPAIYQPSTPFGTISVT